MSQTDPIARLGSKIAAGRATNQPVMVHIGGTPFDIDEVLVRLRPGE